ncbi:putative protein OS=Tsukamurella paurometabola (strain ATCC 8368 / DSM / CCUG 35730 /CIP 100753 / JCM 10117 / KCTC 9821 / NBRC 16120 / NCIMB 702349/ NCTC 13040) OX=521096 GN=Tpau_1178 PE=4 SV=1 [Tsukamurella paurometabola]|uniref:Allophanate hydrolase C-terminal domain-containing protein n=1 Tax=Tsukamurella paurometabola (strain ATCC 8368 / DSM 20162 / CCUG 35730 / CIP 100753 / JCM 10117 / KCTC 9821 / NBRC 16120 / NCIMB 702349 / NCTC 13040) TaxID=521096 RepID=D5UW02_TSUPD|nr:hypothetical protein [Tsukamurella paurometabola]ADG77809.1 hypothetical protein Tpau_1178 [Tsukamurella paurometabola DSM 20162]SUP28837.1 allophanate hydrolase [Tsukamurella paurometabola]
MDDALVLGVNGTLMRGLDLNRNLLDAGARFVRETRTAPIYRLPAGLTIGRSSSTTTPRFSV